MTLREFELGDVALDAFLLRHDVGGADRVGSDHGAHDERADRRDQAPSTSPDEVAAQIQAKILDGSFAPGDRLPAERELASQLRVNRSSVREALKKLEQLRLVDIQRGSGTRVRATEHASFELVCTMLFPAGPANVHWIRELLELREVLSPGVLRLGLARATDAETRRRASQEIRRVADPELGRRGVRRRPARAAADHRAADSQPRHRSCSPTR